MQKTLLTNNFSKSQAGNPARTKKGGGGASLAGVFDEKVPEPHAPTILISIIITIIIVILILIIILIII